MILGVDEVGRGAWAGPIVVGAACLRRNIDGLKDSKLLTAQQRELLAKKIYKFGDVGIGWAENKEIDNLGLSAALCLAAERAVEQIKAVYDEIIIDGTVNFLKNTSFKNNVVTMKKADQLIASVSAASIVAKVARDKHMYDQDGMYPNYGFNSHVGYGTAKHRKMLSELGPSPIHRMSYEPLENIVRSITTTEVGTRAEDLTRDYLKSLGHKIVEQNWKTKFCEVDLITTYKKRLYFTEVKYRRSEQWGSGLEMITKSKLDKMIFAANLYMKNKTGDYSIAVSSVGGSPMKVNEWFEIS